MQLDTLHKERFLINRITLFKGIITYLWQYGSIFFLIIVYFMKLCHLWVVRMPRTTMEEQKRITQMGGTMRLVEYDAKGMKCVGGTLVEIEVVAEDGWKKKTCFSSKDTKNLEKSCIFAA